MNSIRNYRLNSLLAGSCVVLVACCTASAQDAPTNLATTALPLETITLKDGATYKGLLQSKVQDEIEFVEIFLRPGMPMSATARILVPDQIKHYVSLPDNERRILADHVLRLRHRVAIEADNQAGVAIVAAPANSTYAWEYS